MATTILLADDHAMVRDGLRALLEMSAEFEVIGVASSGREAVDQACALQPDIVIMDIAMPEMDGIEATRRIVQKCTGINVLILSMFMSAEHAFRALHAGAQGYVLKESAGEEVVEAIRKLRAGQRYLSHRITDTLVDEYLHHGGIISPLDSLSLREREVLQQVVEGRTNAAIAQSLSLSQKTVETYRARILQKLKLKDTVDLVKFAMRHGLIA
jgi:DNA-binding NarL/FixJ family response regulator